MSNENHNSHTGHMYSHPDSERLRFPARGRNNPGGPDGYAERLRDQVENGKVHEMAISPDIKAGSVIEPSQELGRAWPMKYGAKGDGVTDDTKAIQSMLDDVPYMKGLEFGEGHRD